MAEKGRRCPQKGVSVSEAQPTAPCLSRDTYSSPSPPQNRHCLLDISPHAIERLHHMHIYPIVIFIHYKSAKHIK